MRIKYYIPFTLFLLSAINYCLAQDFITNVDFFGIEQGLSHRDAQCIHQDAKGFIWIGTKYGLNRFDGYHFKWLTKEKNGLQSNEINHVWEDKEGLLWLINTGAFNSHDVVSIDLLDPITLEIQSFEEKFGQTASFSPDEVINFTKNEWGQFAFFSKKNQIITYDKGFEAFPVDMEDYEEVWAMHWEPGGRFFLVIKDNSQLGANSNHSLYCFDKSGSIINRFKHHPSNYIYLYQMGQGLEPTFIVPYLETVTKIDSFDVFKLDQSGEQKIDPFTRNKLSKLNIQFSNIDRIAKWVYGTHFQILYLGANYKKLFLIDQDSDNTTELSQQYPNLEWTTDIILDRSNRIWVSTQFGVFRFDLQKSVFKNFLYDQKNKGNSRDFACRGMTLDAKERLWVMVENSDQPAWLVDTKSSQEMSLISLFPELGRTEMVGTKRAITTGTGGNIYLNAGNTIFHFDTFNDEIQGNYVINDSEKQYIWSLKEDRNGKIWYGDEKNNQIGYFRNEEWRVVYEMNTETDFFVYQFLETDSDTLWVSSNKGLFSINKRTDKILDRYWSKGKGKHLMPYDNIYHIHRDDYDFFWLATSGTGLVKWSPEEGIIQQFTRADGLPNNTLYAIYEDSGENFWMPSDYGIIRFNKHTHQIKGFTVKDGITHNEFNRISHYRDATGNIYFGGLNGVTAFHPNQFINDSLLNNTPLVITDFNQFDGEQNKLLDKAADLKKHKVITLQPTDRFFHLEFALLTYGNVENVQYAYKIEGIESDWTYQKENALRLSRLPYGKHVLRVKGQTPNGQWSEQELNIALQVLKPFYLKTWFYLLMGFTILALVIGYSQWRVKSLRKRQRELENTVKERTKKIREDKKIIEQQAEELKSLEQLKSRFFANVSHELRTPLTLLLGPINTLLEKKKEDGEEKKLLKFVQRNGKQLLKLINEILDLSKLESNKLELEEEPLLFYPFLNRQLAQFHSFAASVEVQLHADFDPDKDLKILLDTNKFEKILHNFVSNALKFTPAGGKVSLTIQESKNQLTLQVRDSGKGIHPDDLPHIFDRFYQSKQDGETPKGGTGIGLSLCKELGNLLGGKVWAESEWGKGSSFYFQFPKKIAPSELIPLSREEIEEVNGVSSESHSESISSSPFEATPFSSPAAAKAQGVTSGPSKATILIVEDNVDLREYLQLILSDYNLITAENGKAGLNCLQHTATPSQRESFGQGVNPKGVNCQLIISDLMMPVMDGFEFMEKVKADHRFSHLPFIVLTAKVNIHAKLKALRIGVDDYLTKPFNEAELIARVENLLKNYAARQNAEIDEAADAISEKIISKDQSWLKKLEEHTISHIENAQFNLDQVSEALTISGRQLQRKLKSLTGLTYTEYLREVRLQKARELLENKKHSSVKAVVLTVGFRDPKYFTTLFKKRFGKTPSDYLN